MIVYVTEISFFKFKEMEIAAQVVVGVMGCFVCLQFYLQKYQLFFYFYPQNLNYVYCFCEK